MRTRFPAVATFALAVACGGCDGGRSAGTPGASDAPGAGGSRVTGSERLGWTQQANLFSALSAYRFDLYVDGVPTTLTDVRCQEDARGQHPCTASFPEMAPGRRSLELVATNTVNGVTSDRSAPLDVEVVSVRSSVRSQALDAPVPDDACLAAVSGQCVDVALVAADLPPVRRLVALPTGDVIVLHRDGAVTTLPAAVYDAGPFVAAAGEEVAAVDLVADSTTPGHLLAVVVTRRGAVRTVRVVRARTLGGRLVEEMTIIPEVPVAAQSDPALAVDDSGRLYLVMPPDERSGDPYAGTVVRFTMEGRADGIGGGPMLARSPKEVTDVTWLASQAVLTAGRDGVHVMADGGDFQVLPVLVPGMAAGPQPVILDLAVRADGRAAAVVAGDRPALWVGWLSAPLRQLVLGAALGLPSVTPEAVTFSSSGDLLVSVRGSASGRTSIVRIGATALGAADKGIQ